MLFIDGISDILLAPSIQFLMTKEVASQPFSWGQMETVLVLFRSQLLLEADKMGVLKQKHC